MTEKQESPSAGAKPRYDGLKAAIYEYSVIHTRLVREPSDWLLGEVNRALDDLEACYGAWLPREA